MPFKMERDEIIDIVNRTFQASVEMETINTLGRFLLLWGIFEKKFFAKTVQGREEGDFNAHKAKNHPHIKVSDIQTPFGHFKDRYTGSVEAERKYNDLAIRGGGYKDEIKQTFQREEWDTSDAERKAKQFAVLMVMYQLRNNLFHGTKEVNSLNENKENFDVMNAVLIEILSKPAT